ncbi:PTS sugar transporter subunit IIB [Thermoanaerobacterium sp. DL9XJH110]|uniref:PTS sugar transporter subunit IIB n=1 Tax=Thermoanaerobacterium sp. DL9XJH110 TaxID=3386643 RepID=UPI003BB7C494
MAKKTILIACGTGICTSTMVAKKLEESLKKKGKDKEVNIVQCKVAELISKAADADLIVSTTTVSNQISTPVIMGTAFLTGIGVDKVTDEIISKLGI